MLKLNAAPTENQPQQNPAIARFQRREQSRFTVGTLQTPQDATLQARTNQATQAKQANKLHTNPWQPMETGLNGTGQVQESIRNLMIRPQQEANFTTDGIHR